MEINTIAMTQSNPSAFGMPACGHAFATTDAFGTEGGFATTSVVRDRQVGVKADLGLAIAYVPGTSAWRPPNS